MGAGEGLMGLSRINRRIVATRIRQTGITAYTLDGDASKIIAEKKAVRFTLQRGAGLYADDWSSG